VKKEFIVERNGRSFVLYAGLLDLAHERGLRAVTTTLVQIPSELNGNVAIVHATVETSQGAFTGLGDAAPENVSRMMLPHLIRMAETRAKARALRDAVNVGVTALEELADVDEAGLHGLHGESPGAAASVEAGALAGRAGSRPAAAGRELRALEPQDVVGAEDEQFELEPVRPERPARVNGHAPAAPSSAALRPGAAPATPKQLQTIQRMARAAGKNIAAEGLTRAQASEIISNLIGEMEQREQRAS
jgi:hypothetical protein